MATDELRQALNEMVHPAKPRISFSLCGKCGQTHDPRTSECPPKHCKMCGTTHRPNQPFQTDNCQRNEQFARYYAGFKKWQKENTRQIWAQPETEEDEEG